MLLQGKVRLRVLRAYQQFEAHLKFGQFFFHARSQHY